MTTMMQQVWEMENMIMDNYISAKAAAERWNVSSRWVTLLCADGKIKGAKKYKNRWMIPDATIKSENSRKKKRKHDPNAKFKFIDLFAGIGGFHQAMRFLGGECVMAAEINQACVDTYNQNFSTYEGFVRGDVNKIDPIEIPPFDVVCAGFPCQPFSKAGQQKGFQDEKRGNLFYKIMDILDAHPEVQFVVLENVRNLADKTENWEIIRS